MAVPLFLDNAENRALGHIGRFQASDLVYSDEFGGSGYEAIKRNRWRDNRLVNDKNGRRFGRTLQQPNVDGHDEFGKVYLKPDGTPQFIHPQGKRHAIWYDKHRADVQFVRDGRLVLGAKYTNERDPTIDITSKIPGTNENYHPYFDARFGKNMDARFKAYGSWLDSVFYMEDPGQGNKKIVDPDSPALFWRYLYFEQDIDFSGQQIGTAYRASTWFMPAVKPTAPWDYVRRILANGNEAGVTYDDDPKTGLEYDVHEHEATHKAKFRQALLMKGISESGSPNPDHTEGTGITYADDYGIDLMAGPVTMGFYWAPPSSEHPTGTTQYLLNGRVVNRDDYRVSEIAQALFQTREGNTTIKGGDSPTPYRPYRQRDAGLFNDSIWENPSLLDRDEVTIGYCRIWQEPRLRGPASDPHTTWRSPRAESASVIDPETPTGDATGDTGAGAGGGFGLPAPANVAVTVLGGDLAIEITPPDDVSGITGWEIRRGPGDDFGVVELPIGTLTYLDETVTPGRYTYTVRSVGADDARSADRAQAATAVEPPKTFAESFRFRVSATKETYLGSPFLVRATATSNERAFPYRFEFEIDESQVPSGVEVSIESVDGRQIAVTATGAVDIADAIIVRAVQAGEPAL